MTKHDLENAIHLLRRVVVHGPEQEVLFRTVEALQRELERRKHHK